MEHTALTTHRGIIDWLDSWQGRRAADAPRSQEGESAQRLQALHLTAEHAATDAAGYFRIQRWVLHQMVTWALPLDPELSRLAGEVLTVDLAGTVGQQRLSVHLGLFDSRLAQLMDAEPGSNLRLASDLMEDSGMAAALYACCQYTTISRFNANMSRINRTTKSTAVLLAARQPLLVSPALHLGYHSGLRLITDWLTEQGIPLTPTVEREQQERERNRNVFQEITEQQLTELKAHSQALIFDGGVRATGQLYLYAVATQRWFSLQYQQFSVRDIAPILSRLKRMSVEELAELDGFPSQERFFLAPGCYVLPRVDGEDTAQRYEMLLAACWTDDLTYAAPYAQAGDEYVTLVQLPRAYQQQFYGLDDDDFKHMLEGAAAMATRDMPYDPEHFTFQVG